MPGYDSDVIMAAGALCRDLPLELSADGPVKPPYAVYFQGGLTWYHAKLGILKSLQSLLDAGVVSREQIEQAWREQNEKENRIAVIGGGVSGMTAAVTAAEQGADCCCWNRKR